MNQTLPDFAKRVPFEVVSAAFTLDGNRSGGAYHCTAGAEIACTIPLLGLPVGSMVVFLIVGAGPILFSPAAGVTLNHESGHTRSGGQFTNCGLYAYGTDEWMLLGRTQA